MVTQLRERGLFPRSRSAHDPFCPNASLPMVCPSFKTLPQGSVRIRYDHFHSVHDYCMERKQPSSAKLSNCCADSVKGRQIRKTSRKTHHIHMKSILISAALAFLFVACDARVTPTAPDRVVEKNTTIITPPAKEEKKVENNTTIINPPAAKTTEEKKTTTTTTTK